MPKFVFFYHSKISDTNEIFETELIDVKGLDDLVKMIKESGDLIKMWEIK